MALTDSGGAVGEGEGRRRQFQELVENAARTLRLRWVQLTRLDEAGGFVRQQALSTLPEAGLRSALALIGSFQPGFMPAELRYRVDANRHLLRVYREGRPVAAPLAVLTQGAVDRRIIAAAASALGMRYVFSCPLWVGGRIYGALVFHSPRAFRQDLQHACLAFARQAVLTLENLRLADELALRGSDLRRMRQLVTETRERFYDRIATTLQSSVEGRLAACARSLEQASDLLGGDPRAASALIRRTSDELDAVREGEIRRLAYELHPATLVRVGLMPALGSLLDAYASRVDVRLEVDPRVRGLDRVIDSGIPYPIRIAAYRIVQEALANAVEHGRAAHACLTLALSGHGRLSLELRDDGEGFDPAAVTPGIGFAVIETQAEGVAGTWRVTGAPGAGSVVHVEVPLEAGEASANSGLASRR